MFADDTAVFKAGRRSDSRIPDNARKLTHWFDANKLTINVDKYEAIPLERGIHYEVQIKCNQLHSQPRCNYLCDYIDPLLTFRDHIDHVFRKN